MKVVKVKGPRQNPRKHQNSTRRGGATEFGKTSENKYKSTSDQIVFFKNIVPQRVVTRLKYLYTGFLMNNGFNAASVQLRANGIFDIDPALASAKVTGFDEWITFFTRYRVLKVKSSCIFSNRENFPILVNLGIEPTFFSPNSKNLVYFENANNKTWLLSNGSSGGTKKLVINKTAQEIYGDPAVYEDLIYIGTPTTNPSGLFYTSAAIDCSTAGTVMIAGGATIRWEVEVDCEFFERRQFVS